MSAFWMPEEAIGAQVDMEEESPWAINKETLLPRALGSKVSLLIAQGDSSSISTWAPIASSGIQKADINVSSVHESTN